MKRLPTLLAVLIVALTSIAWVVKDTANPFQVFTGSNTTPTISAAVDGTVSLGSGTASKVGVGIAAPTVPLDIYDQAAAGTSPSLGVQLRYNTSASAGGGSKISWTNSSATELGYVRAKTESGSSVGLGFGTFNSGMAEVGSVSGPGAWTIGPVGYNDSHIVNGGIKQMDATNSVGGVTRFAVDFLSVGTGAQTFLTFGGIQAQAGEGTLAVCDGSTNAAPYMAKVNWVCDGDDCLSFAEEVVGAANAAITCNTTLCSVTPGHANQNAWCFWGVYGGTGTPTFNLN